MSRRLPLLTGEQYSVLKALVDLAALHYARIEVPTPGELQKRRQIGELRTVIDCAEVLP